MRRLPHLLQEGAEAGGEELKLVMLLVVLVVLVAACGGRVSSDLWDTDWKKVPPPIEGWECWKAEETGILGRPIGLFCHPLEAQP